MTFGVARGVSQRPSQRNLGSRADPSPSLRRKSFLLHLVAALDPRQRKHLSLMFLRQLQRVKPAAVSFKPLPRRPAGLRPKGFSRKKQETDRSDDHSAPERDLVGSKEGVFLFGRNFRTYGTPRARDFAPGCAKGALGADFRTSGSLREAPDALGLSRCEILPPYHIPQFFVPVSFSNVSYVS